MKICCGLRSELDALEQVKNYNCKPMSPPSRLTKLHAWSQGSSTSRKLFLSEERLALLIKVSNIQIFNEDRLFGLDQGSHVLVLGKMSLCHGSGSIVYII